MGTWNAFYVRLKTNDVIAAVRRLFPTAAIESSAEYLGVQLGDDDFEAPEVALADLSARFDTDVMWLGFQSAVDAFQFHHWRSGRAMRNLVYGCFAEERTWERAEGESEPWERAVLFGQEELTHCLKYAGDDDQRDELRRIWRDAEILPGKMEPGLDSRGCVHMIAKHYGLPHYS